MSINKGIDLKLNVKPSYFHLIHESAYEGPCRTGIGEQLTKEFDQKIGEEKFKNFKNVLNTVFSTDYINMLEPEYLTWTDEFILREKEIKKLTNDLNEADLFLFDGVFHQYPASEIAIRFKKPVGVIGCCASDDTTASLRPKGLEAYGYIDPEDASRHMPLLRVKKAIRNTKVLVVLKKEIISKGVLSTITDLEKLKVKLGVNFIYINAEELFDDVRAIRGEQKQRAEVITDELINNAERNTMTRENIQKSVEFYIVIRDVLEKYECNAFTMPCFEVCATRVFNDEFHFTPCLAHSLLKEEGIPSACESDINALMAMNILINLTRKAPHMGNTHPVAHEEKTDQSIPSGLEVISEIKNKKNIISTWHAVPTRKMKGINKGFMPYNIQSFTQSGWGATLRYDYNRDKGEKITLLRLHPTGEKMFAVKGKIVAGAGLDTVGCPTGLYWKVSDVKDFFKKQLDFGHHYAWVYGDYIEQLKDLEKVLGLEVVTA
jgi:L-fucose isomerase-like protein